MVFFGAEILWSFSRHLCVQIVAGHLMGPNSQRCACLLVSTRVTKAVQCRPDSCETLGFCSFSFVLINLSVLIFRFLPYFIIIIKVLGVSLKYSCFSFLLSFLSLADSKGHVSVTVSLPCCPVVPCDILINPAFPRWVESSWL